MVKKKVDPRVRGLIMDGIRKNQRSFFVIVGDHGKDQVENLHKILSKARVKARPSVLWCYKKELGFSSHRKKRIKEIKRDQSRGLYDPERDDPFELFVSSTNIRWTFYKETDKILGQTFGMCILQDFEALTPNILARTIETVEGGGLVIILMKTVKNLKQLYTMTMDVHSRFRTEAHHEVIPRFNERFILSLGDCHGCLVLDDELNILPLSTHVSRMPSDSEYEGLGEGEADASGHKEDPELASLKMSLEDTPNAGALVEMTKTLDQAKAVISFLDAISEKTLRSTVALTAARGRGKSAAIGLCLAGAVAYGYSNIFVTAPSPENLKTVFEFIISGLKALKYTEHLDFEALQEHCGEFGKVVVRINIFKGHRQTIQYIDPSDHAKLAQAELVAIDEAAAIPLPTVKKLMGPYLVFLSSTVNGYEGTGRSLSLKLIHQLRYQQGAAMTAAATQASNAVAGAKSMKGERRVHEERWKVAAEAVSNFNSGGGAKGGGIGARVLTELTLETPIRYGVNDPVEKWLNNLLCLDVVQHSTRIVDVMPAPKDCDLYIVNRDALFSFHALSETILQRIWALYTAAHYKNTPNDLQMLSDAPAHRLFVLLGPQSTTKPKAIPDILCVVQVAFEGFISQKSIQSEMAKSNKASGDMIPWTISQQFNDSQFATLSGARIVRIATHPDLQSMGYGSRAVDLLSRYFQGDLSPHSVPKVGVFAGEGAEMPDAVIEGEVADEDEEVIKPRAKLPPLLTPLHERPAEQLHWLGVSFGLTTQLLNFWSRKEFKVSYVRQTTNDLTGEHSCIVLKELNCDRMGSDAPESGWLKAYIHDYRRRLVSLLSFSFHDIGTALALTLVDPDRSLTSAQDISDTLPNDETSNELTVFDGKSSATAMDVSSPITATELLSCHLSHHDLQRLELYARNMVDHHMIIDMVPILAKFVFLRRLPGVRLSFLQIAILLGVGLQHRSVDSLSEELDLPVNQVLAFFNKTIRKITTFLKEMIEKHVAIGGFSDMNTQRMERKATAMVTLKHTLLEDHKKEEKEFSKKMQTDLTNANAKDVSTSLLIKSSVEKLREIPTSVSIPVMVSEVAATANEEGEEEAAGGKESKKPKKKRKSGGGYSHDSSSSKEQSHKKTKSQS